MEVFKAINLVLNGLILIMNVALIAVILKRK